ncbi:glutamine synthetase [Actinomadura viridis]|uniref:Glutamine synthetase n=1 Tax=Actinomadura viridis TaxID=58110 RepID=A0A931GK32_9ACTN|nr:glutamine synthetase family protein [Actinomadura viridis]MBG6090393.1 glutamine synthetase [Actinomadura viridis]
MSSSTTVFVATNDLSGHTRGRAVPGDAVDGVLRQGVGWVPVDLALTAFGEIAPNPFGAAGDLKLMPDESTGAEIPAAGGAPAVRVYLADQVLPDGSEWPNCPRTFARAALRDFTRATGLEVVASFEHEFMLPDLPAAPPFSFERLRGAEPFGDELVGLLAHMGLEPANWLPEYGAGQFEITVRPATGVRAADRAVLLKTAVRDLARRHGHRVTFAPLVDPEGTGNGVHVHLSLRDAETGRPVLYEPGRPGGLSDLGARFSAGILAHARALVAITACSPSSYLRLLPHRWSSGGIFLAERNREALLRICPTSTVGGGNPADQYNLEFRAADATANPWLTLGVLVRAGLHGITAEYEAPRVWPEEIDESVPASVPTLPRSLEEALADLEKDDVVSGWFSPELLRTHCSVKRSELAAVAGLDDRRMCERVADVH